MAPGGAILVMALFTVSYRMTTQLVIHVSTDNDAFMRHLENGKEIFHILRSIADFLALLLLVQGIEPNPGPLSDGSAENLDLSAKKRQPNTDPEIQKMDVPTEEDPTQTSEKSMDTIHASAGRGSSKQSTQGPSMDDDFCANSSTDIESIDGVKNDEAESIDDVNAENLPVTTEIDGDQTSASFVHEASSKAAGGDDDTVFSDWDDDTADCSFSVNKSYPRIDKDDFEAIFGLDSRRPSQGPSMDDDFRVNSSSESEPSIDGDKDNEADVRDIEHAGNSSPTTEIGAELKSFSSEHNAWLQAVDGDVDNADSDWDEDTSSCSAHPTGITVPVFLTNLDDEEIDALFGHGASRGSMQDPSMDDDCCENYSGNMESKDNRHEVAACLDDVDVENVSPGVDNSAHETSESQISHRSQDCPPNDGRDDASDVSQSDEDNFYGDEDFMTDDDSIESLPFDDNDEIFDNNDDNGVAEMFKNDVQKKNVTFALEDIVIYFDDNEIDSSECSWTLSESFDDTIDDQVFLSDNDSVEDLPLDDVRNDDDLSMHQNEEDIMQFSQGSDMSDMKSSEQSEVAIESGSFNADISITKSDPDLCQDSFICGHSAALVDMPTSKPQSDYMSKPYTSTFESMTFDSPESNKEVSTGEPYSPYMQPLEEKPSPSNLDTSYIMSGTTSPEHSASSIEMSSLEFTVFTLDKHLAPHSELDTNVQSILSLDARKQTVKVEPRLDSNVSLSADGLHGMFKEKDVDCTSPRPSTICKDVLPLESYNVEIYLDQKESSYKHTENRIESTPLSCDIEFVNQDLLNIKSLIDSSLSHVECSESISSHDICIHGDGSVVRPVQIKDPVLSSVEILNIESPAAPLCVQSEYQPDQPLKLSDIKVSLSPSFENERRYILNDALEAIKLLNVSRYELTNIINKEKVLLSLNVRTLGTIGKRLNIHNISISTLYLDISTRKPLVPPAQINHPTLPTNEPETSKAVLDDIYLLKSKSLKSLNSQLKDPSESKKSNVGAVTETSDMGTSQSKLLNNRKRKWQNNKKHKFNKAVKELQDDAIRKSLLLPNTCICKNKTDFRMNQIVMTSHAETQNREKPNRKRKWESMKKQKKQQLEKDTTNKLIGSLLLNHSIPLSKDEITMATHDSFRKCTTFGGSDSGTASDETEEITSANKQYVKIDQPEQLELIEDIAGLSIFYQSTVSPINEDSFGHHSRCRFISSNSKITTPIPSDKRRHGDEGSKNKTDGKCSEEMHVESCLDKNVKDKDDGIDPYSDIKPEYITLFTLHQSKYKKQIHTKDGKRCQRQKGSQTIKNKSEKSQKDQMNNSDKKSKLRRFFRRFFK